MILIIILMKYLASSLFIGLPNIPNKPNIMMMIVSNEHLASSLFIGLPGGIPSGPSSVTSAF